MVAPAEAEWTEDDYEEALAWQEYQSGLCGGCGHPLSETLDSANEYGYKAEIIRCHACATQHKVTTNFTTEGGETPGIMVKMTQVPKLKT